MSPKCDTINASEPTGIPHFDLVDLQMGALLPANRMLLPAPCRVNENLRALKRAEWLLVSEQSVASEIGREPLQVPVERVMKRMVWYPRQDSNFTFNKGSGSNPRDRAVKMDGFLAYREGSVIRSMKQAGPRPACTWSSA